jgi:hypothetical protein
MDWRDILIWRKAAIAVPNAAKAARAVKMAVTIWASISDHLIF